MGEGSELVLLNGTKYTWKRRGDATSSQMNTWKYPDTISPGDVSANYVEFDQNIFSGIDRSKTWGSCVYELDGTDCSFEISIKDEPSNITITTTNITVPQNLTQLPLGWRHDGSVYFVLSGEQGSFSMSHPPVDWMQQNLRTLGDRPLNQICLPGSHDAGMGHVYATYPNLSEIPLATSIFTRFIQTQSVTIAGQLALGSRYFDIRPHLDGGQYYTAHVEQSARAGGRGQSISEVIDHINSFTATHAELVIVNLSHAYNEDFADFTQSEWDGLLQECTRLSNIFICTGQASDKLDALTLKDFIGNGKAAVIIVAHVGSGISLGQFAQQGFYLPSQLSIEDIYSNTTDCVAMVQDQLAKLAKHGAESPDSMFLLSWTLTMGPPPKITNPDDAAGNATRLINWVKAVSGSILDMSYSARKALMQQLLPRVNRTNLPNIIYIDGINSSDYVALAMAVNDVTRFGIHD